MLKYIETNEDLKVSFCELKEQLETPEEAGSITHISQLARNERAKVSMRLSGKERTRCRDTHLKGLVELERRCQDLIRVN